MSGGSSQQQQQTTSTQLSPQQQQLLGLAMPSLEKAAAKPPTLPTDPSQLVAPMNATQKAGQAQTLGATGTESNVVGSAAGGSQFLTSGAALDPSTNPAEAKEIAAATLPIEQNLTENTLPALRSAATGVGQTGSSREGIAEGLAAGRAAQAEGATSADIANKDYMAGLSAMTSGLQTAPAVAGAQTIPGATTSAVGDVNQQQQQQTLDALNMAKVFNAEQPLATGEALAGVAAGIPGATTTSTGTMTGQPSTLAEILGIGGLLTGGAGALLGKGGLSSLMA